MKFLSSYLNGSSLLDRNKWEWVQINHWLISLSHQSTAAVLTHASGYLQHRFWHLPWFSLINPVLILCLLSPVCFSVRRLVLLWFFSLASSTLMLLFVFLSVADPLSLSSFFHLCPPFVVFWLGLLSGALWGNACSLSLSLALPVNRSVHVFVFLFMSPLSFLPILASVHCRFWPSAAVFE